MLRPSFLLRVITSALMGLVLAPRLIADDEQALMSESTAEPPATHSGPEFRYGKKGLEYESADGRTFLWLGLRVQTRFDTRPENLVEPDDLRTGSDPDIDVNRGRIKGGGHVFREWLQVYSEYDFTTGTLLDFKLTLEQPGRFGFRVGQWKSEFNRERIDSSGAQQFVERSLSNYWFTLDRQLGMGGGLRIGSGRPFDSTLYLEYLSGHGRGGSFSSGDGLTLVRWQWNPTGEVLDFSQADIKRRERPVSAVTLATVFGDTPYTRFSSSGGGQLPGFAPGDYRLSQWMLETAWQWKGLSWQQELHWKEVETISTGTRRKMWGGYAQGGIFASSLSAAWPEPLEFVGRVSHVDPDSDQASDGQWEWMIGANWYLNGHRNKISTDLSWLDFSDPSASAASAVRWRLQWDVSF